MVINIVHLCVHIYMQPFGGENSRLLNGDADVCTQWARSSMGMGMNMSMRISVGVGVSSVSCFYAFMLNWAHAYKHDRAGDGDEGGDRLPEHGRARGQEP
jgi:hypothetical protein